MKMYRAEAKNIPFSPYKLRPLVDVIRGKNVQFALGWLATYATRRTMPVKKALESAIANAKHLDGCKPENLVISDFRVDQGPIFRYYKPGAMGRANPMRRRLSHIRVTVADISKKDQAKKED